MNDYKSSQLLMNHIYNVVSDVLKKWQMIIMICVTCALCYDAIQTILYVPIYRCEATFAIKTSNGINYKSESNVEQDIGETFTYILSSNVFKKQIEKNMNVSSLDGHFTAHVQSGTNILHVYADSLSPRLSYEMMDALIMNYQDISHLVVGSANIDLIESVKVPVTPYNTFSHFKNIMMVGSLSLLGVVGIFVILSLLSNTIKDKYEVENKLHLRLLGALPKESKIVSLRNFKRKESILISQYSTSFNYQESFKRIRSRIEKYCHKHEMKVLLMTSSLENEGKSSVSVNTALSLSMNKHKVLLIDADLRKPSLHLILEQNEHLYGIENVLHDHIPLKQAIVSKDEYLDVLFGYGSVDNIDEELQKESIKKLIDEVKENYDYVIIDSSPSRYLSDTPILASYVDGIILVVKQNYANESLILNTIDKLSLSKTPIIGCIHNQSLTSVIHVNGYYGYKYGYNRYYSHRRREE